MSWLLAMTLLVAALMLLPHFYLGWRLKKVIHPISAKLRWTPIALLASFYLLPAIGLCQFLFWGDVDIVSYPIIITYWFWFGFVFTFQILTWVILYDVARFVLNKAWKPLSTKAASYFRGSLIAVLAFLFFFTTIKMWYDTTQIDIDYITLGDSNISADFNDFRIVHISDLQIDEYTGRKELEKYISKVNKLNPNLVIFTGDLISYGTEFIDMAAAELAEVKAKYGLYAVIGDHDYWAGVKYIKAAYQKYGVNLLQNENTVIEVGRDRLLLTGITEVYSWHIPRDSLRRLASARPSIKFEIMISHQATQKVIEVAKNYHYEFLAGGHTHGGQIRVPFMFTHISAPSFETPYLSGVFHLGELLMNINNGLGFTLAPVRYGAQPAISVIDLSSQQ